MTNLYPFESGHSDDPPWARVVWRVYNRSGTTVNANGVYQFDTKLLVNAAETTPNSEGLFLPAVTDFTRGKSGAFGSIIAILSTSAIASDTRPAIGLKYGVALDTVADNEPLDFMLVGAHPNDVLVTGFITAAANISIAAATLSYPAWTPLYPKEETDGLVAGDSNSVVYRINQRSAVAMATTSFTVAVPSAASAAGTQFATGSTVLSGYLFDGWNTFTNRG